MLLILLLSFFIFVFLPWHASFRVVFRLYLSLWLGVAQGVLLINYQLFISFYYFVYLAHKPSSQPPWGIHKSFSCIDSLHQQFCNCTILIVWKFCCRPKFDMNIVLFLSVKGTSSLCGFIWPSSVPECPCVLSTSYRSDLWLPILNRDLVQPHWSVSDLGQTQAQRPALTPGSGVAAEILARPVVTVQLFANELHSWRTRRKCVETHFLSLIDGVSLCLPF